MTNNKDKKVLNVPNLRFPEFCGEWETIKVSELLDFYSTNSLSWEQLDYSNGKIKNLHYGLIHKGVPTMVDVACDSLPYIKEESMLKSFTLFKEGDVAFADASEDTNDVAKAIEVVNCDNQQIVSGLHTIHGRDNSNRTVIGYKGYAFASDSFHKQIRRIAQGTKVFSISVRNFDEAYIGIPSKEEQTQIAKLLITIDKRIATQNKIIEDLKKLKSAIIHRCYSSQTNMIPLSELLKQCSDRNRSGSDLQVLSVSNKYGFIAQSNQFEDREVASDDTSNYKVVKKGMFAYNPARINVGSIALYEMDGNGIVSPMYVCFTTKSELLPSYLKYYFASQTFKHEMYKRLEGSVRLCLTFEELCNIEIHLPSIEQQKNISKYISKIENNLSLVDSIFSKYQQQRRYLLSQMFI